MNKNNIGIIATNILSRGGLNHLINVISNFEYDQLKNNKINKIIIWCNKKIVSEIPKKTYVELRVVSQNFLYKIFWRFLLLWFEIKKSNCNKIVSLDGIGVFFSTSKIIILYQNLLPYHLRTIIDYGFSIKFFKYNFLYFIYKISSFFSDGYIFTSNYSKKIIFKKLSNPKPNIIIPHGVNLDYEFGKHKKLNNKKVNIICVSQIDTYKNYINLLKAFQILIKEGHNINLKIVGHNADQKIFLKVQKLSRIINNIKENSVELLGLKNTDEIKELYQNSDIFIYPSVCESWGLALQEAAIAGLPILCSNNLGHQEYFGDNFLYFNPYNHNDIKVCLLELLKNKNKIEEYQEKARKISKNFSWKKNAKCFLDFVLLETGQITIKKNNTSFLNILKKNLNYNNYYAFNFYVPFLFIIFYYIFGQKELVTYCSVLLSFNSLITISLSSNLRNIILSTQNLNIIKPTLTFRLLVSILIFLLNIYLMKYYYIIDNNLIFKNLLAFSALSLLPWNNEMILSYQDLKKRLISLTFFLDLILVFVCFLLFLFTPSLLIYGLLLFICYKWFSVLYNFIKITYKVDFKILFKFPDLNLLFLSSFFTTFFTLFMWLFLENKLSAINAADLILVFSLSSFPATLMTYSFGINSLKKFENFPLYFNFLIILIFFLIILIFIFKDYINADVDLMLSTLISSIILLIYAIIRLELFIHEDSFRRVLRLDVLIVGVNVILLISSSYLNLLNYFMLFSSTISFLIIINFGSNFNSIKN